MGVKILLDFNFGRLFIIKVTTKKHPTSTTSIGMANGVSVGLTDTKIVGTEDAVSVGLSEALDVERWTMLLLD